MAIEIDTTPIRKAYNDINIKVNDLNKQVRNYSIKTVLKVALFTVTCFAWGFGVTFAHFSLAGITLPIATWGLKAITTLTLAGGLGIITVKFMRAIEKTQNEFSSKINRDLKESCKDNFFEINKALFGSYSVCPCTGEVFCGKKFKRNDHYMVDKIKLDSYETIEKRYIDKQRENIRQQTFLREA